MIERMERFRLVVAYLAFLALGAGSINAHSQDFPNKPVRIIVPYTPGTQTDVVARMVANHLTDRFKQQVVVDNRAGAGGSIGIAALKTAPADGYTIGVLVSANAVQPWIRKDMPFDIRKDFAPITLFYFSPLVMMVPASHPARNLAEFIAHVRSNPGKVFYGSIGIGTTTHLAAELLAQSAGVTMTHVPMKGSPELYPPMFSGDTQMAFDGYTTPRAFIEAGKLRVIAVSSKARMPILPQVPAISETYPGFDVVAWTGVAAPAGTPKEAIDRLTDEIRGAIQSPEMRKRLTDLGVQPGGVSSTEFAQLIQDNYEKFGKAIQAAGIKPE